MVCFSTPSLNFANDLGTLASLKNVKKDVQEMKKGSECGVGFDGWFDFHVGDQVQSYEQQEEQRYL